MTLVNCSTGTNRHGSTQLGITSLITSWQNCRSTQLFFVCTCFTPFSDVYKLARKHYSKNKKKIFSAEADYGSSLIFTGMLFAAWVTQLSHITCFETNSIKSFRNELGPQVTVQIAETSLVSESYQTARAPNPIVKADVYMEPDCLTWSGFRLNPKRKWMRR